MTKSPFRYPGGKSRIAQKIISYFPKDIEEYREPFVGGGSVFFQLNNNIKYRWINDLDSNLISVYYAFRDRAEEFIKLCRSIESPKIDEEKIIIKKSGNLYPKRIVEKYKEFLDNDNVDPALRYFFLNRTSYGGRVNYDSVFRCKMCCSNPDGWKIIDRPNFLESIANHLKSVKITSRDFEDVIYTDDDSVLIYADPPYVRNTELSKTDKLYNFGFTMKDHERFAEICKSISGKIVISYDDHPLVRSLFKSFNIHELKFIYGGQQTKNKKEGKELIITNY